MQIGPPGFVMFQNFKHQIASTKIQHHKYHLVIIIIITGPPTHSLGGAVLLCSLVSQPV